MSDEQSTSTKQLHDAQPSARRSNAPRMTLLIIIVVSVLPIAFAYIAFFTGIGVPDNTVNKGILLNKAVKIQELDAEGTITFSTANEAELGEWLSLHKKWRIVVPVLSACSEACQQMLYTTRQVHIRLGEKGLRLERLIILLDETSEPSVKEKLLSENPKAGFMSVGLERWQAWLKQNQTELPEHFYFLLDQQGYSMMYYTPDHHGNDLLKDIKRALKHSINYQ